MSIAGYFSNAGNDIGSLASGNAHGFNEFAGNAYHSWQPVAERILYNPVTLYANEVYQKTTAFLGGDIHPDGKKLIIGAVAFLIISLGIYGLFNYKPGHGAGDNSLSSTDAKRKKSLKHPDR